MGKLILVLGSSTSLGAAFVKEAKKRGHRGVCLDTPILLMRNDEAIASWLHRNVTRNPDWLVNCYGRNQLDEIGKTPYQENSRFGAGFTNSLLIDNVTPLYWMINGLIAEKFKPMRVLSVASQTYRIAQTNTAMYCASKAALVQLSRTMARELAPKGWVINCLAPGKITDTEMAKLTDAQVLKLRKWTKKQADAYALRGVPMRRFTTRAEVCEAMFKILDLPAYINGTCIDMTGGA